MSPTRRRIVTCALPAIVGLAGCSGTGDPPDDAGSERRDSSGTERDPAVRKPRNPGGDTVIVDSDADGPTAVHRSLIRSQDEADALVFADGVSETDVASTRAFLHETAFDEETVYVTQLTPQSCYQYRINSVSWGPSRVEYDYCRELRPPEDRCEAGRRDALALCIRIPGVLTSGITSAGASGRAPCENSETEYETIDANASDASNASAESTNAEADE